MTRGLAIPIQKLHTLGKMQKIGKVQTPRCEICNKPEFKNKVFYANIWDGKIHFHNSRVVMCKDCEAKQKIIARTQYGEEPIYDHHFFALSPNSS